MQRFILFLILSIWSSQIDAQKNYFQQSIDYKLNVTLNDQSHILRGFESIRYTNHSTDTLKFIYFHLWPNAYRSDQSAYVEQAVQNKQTDFYFSKEDDRGFIDSIDFKIDAESVSTSNYNGHEDIVILELNKPLLPSGTIEITTPFRVVLPFNFSRLGHVGQSYQISQWYPKPAVYDSRGWHPMPYLDQGEFYSEFGNYEVSIQLPSNYIVAATGDLQEESEKIFIRSLCEKNTQTQPKTELVAKHENKTITFKQNNVHDFAWFADKDLIVEFTPCTLSNGKLIDCYSYFKPNHKNIFSGSSQIISKAIKYYSDQLGDYPYQQASIVEGPLTAGSGMEYPNVAIIAATSSASQLQSVLLHEICHNWFYGILGNNERDYPWLDESFTTYYESLLDDSLRQASNKTFNSGEKLNNKLNGLWRYQMNAKQQLDQAILTHSIEFTSTNYGAILYAKGPQMIAYLKAYLGDLAFNAAMKIYFDTWKFKHPYPEDFEKIMRGSTNKNLDWFFADGLKTNKKIDFKIGAVKRNKALGNASIQLKSNTNFTGPVSVSACDGDQILQTKWLEYPYEEKAIFTSLSPQTDRFWLNAHDAIPETIISNNVYKLNSLSHKFHPAIRLGTSLGPSKIHSLNLLPVAGYNFYDNIMLGLAMHNIEFPNHKFQFAFAPLYSTAAKTAVGSGFASYTLYPRKQFQSIYFGIEGRSYHANESDLNIDKSIFLRYTKLMPFVRFEFKKPYPRSPVARDLLLQTAFIKQQSFAYTLNTIDSLFRPSILHGETALYYRALYNHQHERTFNPFGYQLLAEGGNSFMKMSVTGHLKIDYFKKNKAFHVRFFAGKFFDYKNSQDAFALRNNYLTSTYSSNNDFMYNHIFLARHEQTGFLTNQISMREGGFKIQSNLLSNPIGRTNNWLTAINLRSDIPIGLPIKLQIFIDAATYANAATENASGNKMIYDGGVELHLLNDLVVVYAPFMMSKDFKDYTLSTYPKNRFLNTISFSLNFDKIQWFRTHDIIARWLR